MVNAQKWLDKKYINFPQRSSITELNIKGINLKGDLSLEGFYNLEVLDCSQNQLTGLDVGESGNLRILYCGNNQLQNIRLGKLRNIETLYCEHNILTGLNLARLTKLKELNCANNQLSDINLFLQLPYPEKLISLNISSNNFSCVRSDREMVETALEEQEDSNLLFLTSFANLVNLDISNRNYNYNFGTSTQQRQTIRNKFYGSLKPLQNLRDLKRLDITNTGINSGLHYLSRSLEDFFVTKGIDWNNKGKISYYSNESVRSELVRYGEGHGSLQGSTKFDIKKWRKNNYHLFANQHSPQIPKALPLNPEQELAEFKIKLGGHRLENLLQLWQDFSTLQKKLQVYFKKELTISELEGRVIEELSKNSKTIQSLQQQFEELKKVQTKLDEQIRNIQEENKKLKEENKKLKQFTETFWDKQKSAERCIKELNGKLSSNETLIRKLEREKTELTIDLKNPEFERQLNLIKNRLNNEAQELLENLLEAQIELMSNANNSFAQKQLVRAKKVLSKYNLSEEELQNLLARKAELTYLEEKLESLRVETGEEGWDKYENDEDLMLGTAEDNLEVQEEFSAQIRAPSKSNYFFAF